MPMKTVKTVPWIELMQMADEAAEAFYVENDDGVQAAARLGDGWYVARARVPLAPRATGWEIDADGFAYQRQGDERDYPKLAASSWAGSLARESLRAPIVAALCAGPSPLLDEFEEIIEAYRYVSLIDSDALYEFGSDIYPGVMVLQDNNIDPEDRERMLWKLYLHRVCDHPTYRARVAESRDRLARTLRLDRTTFLAELEARGFRRRVAPDE